jgi:environmental stress-induced protein Ves
MRILRAADHRVMPWKNGGGVTTEIAVFPEGAGLDALEWRISMATVAGDGPFSLFPGIDRTLAVLEGEGIMLSVDGWPDATLTRTSPLFAFPADRTALARLLSGPVTDFNVMTRRGQWRHRVERVAGAASAAFPGGALTVVFCATGSALVSADGTTVRLGLHDAAMVEHESRIEREEGAGLFAVALEKLR